MASSAKPASRFVPTLTQVVATSAPVEAARPSADGLSQEALIAAVVERVRAALQRELPEAVTRLVLDHVRALEPQIRAEIDVLVRKAAMQGVAQELEARNGQGTT